MDTYTTRCTLLNRARDQSDSEAWEELISFYRRYIYVVIRSMKIQQQDAEDILQHTLIELWKYLPDFTYDREKSKFRHWVATVTRNQVYEFIRKKKTHLQKLNKVKSQVLVDYLDTIVPPEIDQLVTEEWKTFITNTAMQNIQGNFTPQAINAFKLFTHGTSVTEVSEQLEIKADSIYKYISRIKRKLVEEIKRLKSELDF